MQTINLLINWGGGLMLAFLVLLALPQSKLKEVVMPFVGWAVAALSVGYIISPIDIFPDFVPVLGWGDDLVALAVGIGAICTAINAGKPKQLP